MNELFAKVFIFLVVLLFASACFSLARPVSSGGRLSLKLCIANAVGWLLILPMSDAGHPPPSLIATAFFGLINLVLIPAATVALWISYKEREERARYLAVAGAYITLNLLTLFVIPLVWLLSSASRN